MSKSILDKLAGEDSVAGKLKKMREQMESGDAESMHPKAGEVGEKPKRDHKNDAPRVIRRGYMIEDE